MRMIRSGRLIAVLMLAFASAQAGTVTLPAGTKLQVILETTLTTKLTRPGDPFRSRLVMPLFLDQRQVVPMGTAVVGKVVTLQGAKRVKGRAEMQLTPEKLLLPDGRDIELAAALEAAKTDTNVKVDPKEGTVKAPGKDKPNMKKVATGGAISAGLGAAMGGATGAAMGAGSVVAIAVLGHLLKKGKEAVLPAGSELTLELTRPVSFQDMEEIATPPAGLFRKPGDKKDERPPDPPVMQPSRDADQKQ